MAYATDFRTAQSGFFMDRVHTVVDAFRKAREQRKVYNVTLQELRSLNARELADLGISASEIPFIATEAAKMVK